MWRPNPFARNYSDLAALCALVAKARAELGPGMANPPLPRLWDDDEDGDPAAPGGRGATLRNGR